ncbi:MAG: hypothetical protein R2834_08905 [Rhodothermales bacterium]
MRIHQWIAGVVLALIVATAAAAFLAGPLLPWSPVRPGYTGQKAGKALLIVPRETPLPPGFVRLDALIGMVEERTGLWLESPVRIVLAGSWGQFNRGALLGFDARPGEVLGATLPTGTIVYLSPRALEPDRNASEVLLHEMTHAVLFQHMSLPNSFAFRKLDWLEEGLAEHIGDANPILSDSAWSRLAVDEGYLYPVTQGVGSVAIPDAERYRFVLESQRLFVQYLMVRFGSETFYQFLDRVLADPERHAEAFQSVFGLSEEEADAAFAREVSSGAWPIFSQLRMRP